MSGPVMKLQNTKDRRTGHGQVQMLELALPIPLDQQDKVRALKYLHEAVQTYIDDFCGGTPAEERPTAPAREPERPSDSRRNATPKGLSLCQAIQVFLCFYLCLFI